MSTAIEREARESYEAFVALRDEIDAEKKPWSALADSFTEDAAYIDPAWGSSLPKAWAHLAAQQGRPGARSRR